LIDNFKKGLFLVKDTIEDEKTKKEVVVKTIDEIVKPRLEDLTSNTSKLADKWYKSKFEAVKAAANSTKGTFGEELTVNLIKNIIGMNAEIINGGIGDFDILTETSIKIEHKLATEDTNGKFQFNSLKKDADYDYAFCLGVSPNDMWFMVVPKDEIKKLTTSMNPGTEVYKLTGSKKLVKSNTVTSREMFPLTPENFKREVSKIV